MKIKKILNYIVSICILQIVFLPICVNANIICNDGTTSPSCSDCHRGCCSHHGGCSSGYNSNSYSSSDNIGNYSNNSSSNVNSDYLIQQPIIEEKSNDTSLKSIIIDYENIDISDNMSYTTNKEKVNLYVVANDTKTTTEYDNNPSLNIGNNLINIKVTAENSDVKEYKLNIIREKILSDNKNIEIEVDGEEITFSSFKSQPIYISNDKNKIDIKYELEDKNAKAEIIGNENLKVGTNEVIVKVTAENGQQQNYTILINKSGTKEETPTIISLIIIIIFFFGIGYFIYYKINRVKKK